MHKKNNFQLHQLYFASPEAPPGQDRQSLFGYMVDHPEEIRVFRFSVDQKNQGALLLSKTHIELKFQVPTPKGG